MTKFKPKLYVVVRNDLSPGYQIVQTAHAVADWTQEYPGDAERWNRSSNTMVVLKVNTQSELVLLFDILYGLGLGVTPFHEPDIKDEMTAFAFLPSSKYAKLLSTLPLAGS